MERIEGINPRRIEWCLADSGTTVEQLAYDLGIAQASIEAVLAGDGGLTFNQLRKVGGYFGRTALFFLESGDVSPAQIRSPAFRTLTNQKTDLDATVKKIIELAEWQRDAYIDLLSELDRDDEVTFAPPDVTGLTPDIAAQRARTWLQLNQTRTFTDYRSAIEAKGVLVFRTNGYAGKWQLPKGNSILGFSLYRDQFPLIVVKKQAFEARQTFTLVHELGHLLMHRTSMIDDERDFASNTAIEAEANKFAAYFLVPPGHLAAIQDADRPEDVAQLDEWLAPYKRAWGVSTEVILLRLLSVGRILQPVYAAYKAWLSRQRFVEGEGGSRMYRYREPKHLFGDGYVRTVLDALDANKVSLVRASKYLDGLKLNDIRQLERHYAGI